MRAPALIGGRFRLREIHYWTIWPSVEVAG